MFNKQLFILAHQIGDRSFYPTYQLLVKNQWRPYAEMKENQEKQLRRLISFAYENVPYYHNLFKELKLFPKDIHTIEDLQKLPILTKGIIKQHWEDFKPANLSSLQYYDQATGGSTGIPLHYRLLKQDRFLGGALLYRGWGYGGYQLGDRMVFLAGSSLDVGTKSYLTKKTHEIARNIRKLSSFDMGEKEMRHYAEILNAFKPRFIRGYASSLFFYAQWLEKNDVAVSSPDAVFTTAEKLFPPMRETIGRVFGCQVFEEYGLNDGGISANECPEHSGLHIDTERSIMEVVDSGGSQIDEGQGQVLATSLHNYAMPFIRYHTEDIASILNYPCACGRQSKVLDNIIGREKEFLITPNGQFVHGAALFNLILDTLESSSFPDSVNTIKEFQIIQRKKEKIEILFVCDRTLPNDVLEFIQSAIQNRFHAWEVEFRFVDAIDRSRAGKYKFIINEMLNA
jgi:phenylacetate-CoA ligase